MKAICSIALLGALYAGTGAAADRCGALPGATVDSVIECALKNNPGLAAAALEAQAAKERIVPAGALPDPSVRIPIPFGSHGMFGSDSRTTMSMPGMPSASSKGSGGANDSGSSSSSLSHIASNIQVSQTFPLWGKLDLMRGIAEAEADRGRAERARARATLIAAIKTAYIQQVLVLGEQALDLEMRDLLTSAELGARDRYAAGAGMPQDAIRASMQLTRLQSELAAQDGRLRELRARLNSLMGRPVDAPLAEPREWRVVTASTEHTLTSLARRLHAANPELFSQERRVRIAELRHELAERSGLPDLTLGISFLQAMVELINIPLQQESRRAQVREAAALASAEKARKAELQNRLLAELIDHLAAAEAAAETARLGKTSLLPQAQLNLDTTLAAYGAGRGRADALLETRMQIVAVRMEHMKAEGEQQLRLVEIERLLGERL
jgi:outer membrane protein TolC